MAALDNDHLVVRVVYTGPPMAGKTESMRALMPLLRGKGAEALVHSPGEWRGRTGFFDWADYEGGAYEGRTIRCQIMSTPGQVALSDRRELLLRSADAVIMVVASEAEALERATQCYEEMAPWLDDAGRDVPVRLILQCNKQDLPGALPADELARTLQLPCGKDYYATSARTGKGLRAAFVAGVRRAVERARALVDKGVVLQPPDLASGEELYERMRRQVTPLTSTPFASRASVSPTSAPAASGVAASDAAASRPAPFRAEAAGSTSSRSGQSAAARPAPASSAGVPASARSAPVAAKSSRSGMYPALSSAAGARVPGSRALGTSRVPGEPIAGPNPLAGPGPLANPRAASASRAPSSRAPASRAPESRVPGSKAPASSTRAARQPQRPGEGATGAARAGAIKGRGASPSSAPRSRPSPAGDARPGDTHAAARAPTAAPPAPASVRSELPGSRTARPQAAATVPAPRNVQAPARRDSATGSPAGGAAASVEPAVPPRSGRAEHPARSSPAAARAAVAPPGTSPTPSAARPAESLEVAASAARRAMAPAAPAASRAAVPSSSAAAPAAMRHETGSLDPAGAAARAWRPGSGPRPAVLPASAHHLWVPEAPKPSSAVQRRSAGGVERGAEALPLAAEARSAAAAARVHVEPRTALRASTSTRYAAGDVRPAVMPASAYHAALDAARGGRDLNQRTPDELQRNEAALSDAALSDAAVSDANAAARDRIDSSPRQTDGSSLLRGTLSSRSSAPPTHASRGVAPHPAADTALAPVRPAVMPASAYHAALRARTEPASTATRPARQGLAGDDASAAVAPRVAPAAGASPARPTPAGAVRPAVMPASAYFAALAAAGSGNISSDIEAAERATGRSTLAPASAHEDRGAARPVGTSFADSLAPPLAGGAPAVADSAPQAPAARVPQPSAEALARARAEFGVVRDVEAPLARELVGRPATMPADSYFAWLAAGATEMPALSPAPARVEKQASPRQVVSPFIASDVPARAPAVAVEGASAAAALAAPAERSEQSSKPARPAVMPASAWRASNAPDHPALEQAPFVDAARTSHADAAHSEPALVGADRRVPEAAPSVLNGGKSGAQPSLQVLQGGTQQRRPDANRTSGPRPSLTLLTRPAVMPASAWRDTPPSQGAVTAARAGAIERSGSERSERGQRPAVMPASAWRAQSRSVEAVSEPRDVLGDAGAPNSPGRLSATVTSSDGVSSSGRLAVSSEPSAKPTESARALHDVEVLPPGAPALPGNDVIQALAGERPAASTTSADEPSDSFQIPETPPGLQAFIKATSRPPYSDPFTEPPSEASDGWDVADAASRGAAVGESAPPATIAAVADARQAGHEHEDLDHSMSSLPEASELPPFSFPGPRLPGQARAPLAVWRRSSWRVLETQLTAYASTLQDARGRWIGELAPGWFARTLRSAPDERSARRVLAEQVLRERRLGHYLSRPRCVVLTREADLFWIWQVACRVPTLATLLRPRLAGAPAPSAIADALLEASLAYLDARTRFIDARVPLPVSPHALSHQDGRIVYSGLMPDPGAVYADPVGNGYAAFEQALRKMWPAAPTDAQAVLTELNGRAAGRLPEPLLEIIRSVVGQD
jgi:signal recognition particle receptor subunit beta